MEQIATDGIACLLVHGLNGLRYDFDDIAAHLRAQGYATEQLLLPGHEVHVREAGRFGWRDWTRAMQEQFDRLAAQHQRVVVIGHSMGGALALHLAAREPRVAAVAALCAPTALHPGLMPIVRLSRRLLPYMPLVREDIRDPAERRAYRRHKVSQWVSLAPLHTLLQELPALRAALPQVRCPTLLIGARNDHVVPVRDAYIIYNSIGSRYKQLFVLERSWHMVTRDVESEIVTDHIMAFLERMRAML
jgi:carboxylesterase